MTKSFKFWREGEEPCLSGDNGNHNEDGLLQDIVLRADQKDIRFAFILTVGISKRTA